MKREKVKRILNISNSTIYKWSKNGKLKVTRLPSGFVDYDDDVVYELATGSKQRMTIIYGRVSTGKQKKDLENQMKNLESFCAAKGWFVDKAFKDIASGVTFEKRKQFFKMLDLIEKNKVDKVIITHKDRLSRIGFDMFKTIFDYHDTQIIVLSDLIDEKTDKEEIFEEIISLLHCFSMKMYAQRRAKMRKILKESGADVNPTDARARRKNG